ACGEEVWDAVALEAMAFRQALILEPGAPCTVQLLLEEESSDGMTFRISSRKRGAASNGARGESRASGEWELHATGRTRRAAREAPGPIAEPCAPEGPGTPGAAHYQRLAEQGLAYGPAFQGVRRVWGVKEDASEVQAEVALPEVLAPSALRYRLHPSL